MNKVDLNDLMDKALRHKATIDASKRDIRDNLIIIKQEEDKLSMLNREIRTSRDSYEYLNTLIKEESGKFIKSLNDTLNYAVKTIFYDCEYSIDIRTEDNDKISIRLKYTNDDGIPVDADIQKCGGGIRTVVGTVLMAIFIFRYRAEPILFIDEGLSQVSSQYLPHLFGLLKELSIQNNLKILLITHDTRFIDYADYRYEVKDGLIKEIKEDRLDDDSVIA